MNNSKWKNYTDKFNKILNEVSFIDNNGVELEVDKAFSILVKATEKIRHNSRSIFLVGNGASASMASHFAADMAKNAHLHTEVFSDLSLITAISNDMGYDKVFAEPLRRRGRKGDMLIAISSSGKSPNVLEAVKLASQLDMFVFTLSAMSQENPLRRMGNINAHVKGETYGFAETSHAAILHYLMDMIELK